MLYYGSICRCCKHTAHSACITQILPTAHSACNTQHTQILDVGARVQELPGESIELPAGQVLYYLGWSKDGQVRGLA